MAPEMLKNNSVSTQSDVYALGITIWQLQHRRVPYSTMSNEEQVIYGVVKNNLRPSDHLEEEGVKEKPNANPFHRLHKKKVDRKLPELTKSTALPCTKGLTWKTEEDADSNVEIKWNAIFSVDQKDTPPSPELLIKYQELYTRCWHRKPKERPLISQVLQELKELLSQLN